MSQKVPNIPQESILNVIEKMSFQTVVRLRQSCRFMNQTVQRNIHRFTFNLVNVWDRYQLQIDLEGATPKIGILMRGNTIQWMDPSSLEGIKIYSMTFIWANFRYPRLGSEDSIRSIINILKQYRIRAGKCYYNRVRIRECAEILNALGVTSIHLFGYTRFEDLYGLQQNGIVQVDIQNLVDLPNDFFELLVGFESIEISNSGNSWKSQSLAPLISSIIENEYCKLREFEMPLKRNELFFGEEEKKMFDLDSKLLHHGIWRCSLDLSARYSAYLIPITRGYLLLIHGLNVKHIRGYEDIIYGFILPDLTAVANRVIKFHFTNDLMREEIHEAIEKFGKESYCTIRLTQLICFAKIE